MLADMEDFFTYLIVSVITISCVRNIYGFYSTDLVLRRPETSATDGRTQNPLNPINPLLNPRTLTICVIL